jgi:hypothetical protein
MDSNVSAKLAQLLDMRIQEMQATQQVKTDELTAAQNFRNANRQQIIKDQETRNRYQDICDHRHEEDGNSMIDVIVTFSGPQAACARCGREWSGNSASLRQQLGPLYPKDTRISGISH